MERNVSFRMGGLVTTAERYDPTFAGPHPAVILLYGSGGMKGAEPAYRWYATSLADAGMVTLICPYFDATHGRQHREPANIRQWVPAVKNTITYLQRQPNVDPHRIGIIGFSLGGFLGLSTAAQDMRVKALVDFFGPEPILKESAWRRFPPTLILHGEQDSRVEISQSRDVTAHLLSAGVAHRLVVYPDQGHGFTEPAASDAHAKAVAFLAQQLHSTRN